MGVIGGASFELTLGADVIEGNPPQFLGAMLVGPLAGWVMREVDKYLEPALRQGLKC